MNQAQFTPGFLTICLTRVDSLLVNLESISEHSGTILDWWTFHAVQNTTQHSLARREFAQIRIRASEFVDTLDLWMHIAQL